MTPLREALTPLGGVVINVVLGLFVVVLLSARHGNGAKPLRCSCRVAIQGSA